MANINNLNWSKEFSAWRIMFRKCTIFDGKSCWANYTSTKLFEEKKYCLRVGKISPKIVNVALSIGTDWYIS